MLAAEEITKKQYSMRYIAFDNGLNSTCKGTLLLVGILFASFWLQWFFNEHFVSKLFLSSFSLTQLFSHQFLHADSIHLIINMILLYIFGRIVEARLGVIALYFSFILFGVAGGVLFLICGGQQAVGASGAVSGLIGLSLILDSKTKIYFFDRKFYISVYLMAGLWAVKDLIAILFSTQRAVPAGHLGGLIIGVFCGLLICWFRKKWHTMFN